ncbi:neurogenic locus notch homolog protein 1-like [Periplaneta americana]|uniref:neurogenic locus notch homolog protein 1-like n=1 Tax=Periplaneta americana TaxID=6978 RepID=UPI0037E7EAAD
MRFAAFTTIPIKGHQDNWLVLLLTACCVALTTGYQKCSDGFIICGIDAICEDTKTSPRCVCPPDYHGNPKVECLKSECVSDSDCPRPQRCKAKRCKDLCLGICGEHAHCKVKPGTSIPVCYCPPGYTGNPLISCRQLGPQELCETSNPCGDHTNCKVGKERGTAICSCKKGYKGNPLKGCEPECYTDSECKDYESCIGTACVDVCHPSPCGKEAYCKQKDHQAECECPHNRVGNPWEACRPECKDSYECPFDRPVCFDSRCTDPCLKDNGDQACGTHATCTIKNNVGVCSCPKGYTGDPLKLCRPLQESEVCSKVRCGINALCTPKRNEDGDFVAVCSCPRLHKGNALKRCDPVECDKHDDCPISLSCRDWKCQDPCPSSCGEGANCRVNEKRVIVCSCPHGTVGNPMKSCKPTNS